MLQLSQLMRYTAAILSVGLALWLTLLLRPLLAPTVLPLFFLSVTFSVWYGGREAGFVATILSVIASYYFLFPPLTTASTIPSAAIVELIVFSLVTVLISRLQRNVQSLQCHSRDRRIELEQTEAALQESDARYQTAAESSFDAIYIFKSVRNRAGEIVDFQFVDLNEQGAQLISRAKTDILQQNLCELLPINKTQGFFDRYKQVVETGIPLEEEFCSTLTPGKIRWLRHHVVRLGDGLAITTRDITASKQAEAALRDSELLYRTLAESIPQLVWTQDASGKIDYANQQWQRALGVTLEQVERDGWAALVHPQDLPRLLARQEVSVRDGDRREAEFRYRMANGSYRWFLGRCVPIKDAQGQVLKWVGTSTDIHDLKRYEQELSRQKQQFKTLADNSPDIIARIDRNFRHLYVNSAIEQATGLSPDTYLGKTNKELGWPPELCRDWQARMEAVFDSGQACSLEFTFPSPNGDRHYQARLVPECMTGNEIKTLLCIITDITDFVQSQQALRQSEMRFRRMMESNMLGMGFWTLEGDITEANDALLNMLGYTREEFLAHKLNWRDITPPIYSEQEQAALAQIRESGVCSPFEKAYIHKNGSLIPVLCGGAAFTDTVESGVFFVLDLSDRKRIEKERDRLLQLERAARAEAEAANRVKDEFLMVLSHELRTPLNPILGWTRLLQTRQFAPGMTMHALNTIERNAKHQAQLVEDLLDISRILQGKLTLNFCPVDLGQVIEAAIASLRLSAEAKAIQIKTHLDANVQPILGNETRLRQVVWNLLSNAIKFTATEGSVDVHLTQVDNQAQIQVCDTGKGIDAKFLPYVFDYFRQSDSTTTRTSGGLGLGLAITRHLVELHGGTIEASSEGIGQGAIFTLRLPLQASRQLLSEPIPYTAPEQLVRGKQFLVVQTKPDARELTTVILQQAGATVVAVDSAEAALAALARSRPDLLIGTLEILRENDYALMQRLRLWSQEFGEEILVIALAAYPEEIDQQEAIAAGLQHILPNLSEPDEWIGAIAHFISHAS